MTETIRILIADDHPIVREGLRGLIATEAGMEVVGEAADGIEAVQKVQLFKPDVILLDLVMPRMDGIAAIGKIRQELPEARILVLTGFAEEENIFPALRAGALGYLPKESLPHELIEAIRTVSRGEASLHPTIVRKLIDGLNRPPDVCQVKEILTARETEVLSLLAQGLSNQHIADQLIISERTVRGHVSSILSKLHLPSRTQAALYALREGLAHLDSA